MEPMTPKAVATAPFFWMLKMRMKPMIHTPRAARMVIWHQVMAVSFLFRLKMMDSLLQVLTVSQATRLSPRKTRQRR